MQEKIQVKRGLVVIPEINIEFVRVQKFQIGNILHGAYPHSGKDGKDHQGNLRVIRIIDPLSARAEAKCTQPGCYVSVEVVAVAPKTEE